MLQEIQGKIQMNEGVLAKVDYKLTELKRKMGKKDFDSSAYWYWIGVRFTLNSEIKDLKELQEVAEQEISFLDHSLDALRG